MSQQASCGTQHGWRMKARSGLGLHRKQLVARLERPGESWHKQRFQRTAGHQRVSNLWIAEAQTAQLAVLRVLCRVGQDPVQQPRLLWLHARKQRTNCSIVIAGGRRHGCGAAKRRRRAAELHG